ncbi:MAG: peptide chain release factor N(5)-glutamine methyltransferase [Mycetocola sp.]
MSEPQSQPHPFPSLIEQPEYGPVRREIERLLDAAGIPTPAVDAELLMAFVTSRSRGEIQSGVILGRSLTEGEAAALGEALSRRLRREPLQHITGRASFRTIELAVGPGVFVPRPETELLVQLGLDELARLRESADGAADDTAPLTVVDLGTGSGAIALSVATEAPASRVWAVEGSPDAFVWAEQNRRELHLENATVVRGDLADALPELDGTVDLLLSNPPYVPDDAIPRDPEVRLFDPAMALYGGADGLDIVRILAVRGAELLRPGRLMAIEHGEYQGADIRAILSAAGWCDATTVQDLTKRDRITLARRPG